jgi:hypothetical protein
MVIPWHAQTTAISHSRTLQNVMLHAGLYLSHQWFHVYIAVHVSILQSAQVISAT